MNGQATFAQTGQDQLITASCDTNCNLLYTLFVSDTHTYMLIKYYSSQSKRIGTLIILLL